MKKKHNAFGKHDEIDFHVQFQPVQQELAQLVTIVRQLEQTYQQIGKSVAKVEHMVRSWDEVIQEMRENAEAIAERHLPSPPSKPKGKAKVLPFKRKKP
jgi:uncharacterized protein YukE